MTPKLNFLTTIFPLRKLEVSVERGQCRGVLLIGSWVLWTKAYFGCGPAPAKQSERRYGVI